MQEQVLLDEETTDDKSHPCPTPTLTYARNLPTIRPYAWPRLLAVGAGASHVAIALVFGLAFAWQDHLGGLDLVLGLLCVGVLGPLGAVCSLAGIGLVRWHLNGWVLLASILTLPLNLYLCYGLYDIMTNGIDL